MKNTIDRDRFTIIAGPCTIDSKEQIERTARALTQLGISFLRGGAFKMRTSPDSWQGLGREGLSYLKSAADKTGMQIVSEVTAVKEIELMTEYVDVLLVGTRNMQNYPLLSELAKTNKPVILKRGMGNTVEEWIKAAEYLSSGGNDRIVLCERGIRTFETVTRNTLDLSVVPIMKKLTPYPVIVDPSHATGRADIVKEMCWAAAACGADGIMVECDVYPQQMRCDAQQTIDIAEMKEMLEKLPAILSLWGKKIRTDSEA